MKQIKGIHLALNQEKLKETRNLSPEMKLKWLEEANAFISRVNKKTRK